MNEATAILPAAAGFFLLVSLGCIVCGILERREAKAQARRHRINLFQTGGLLK